MHVQARREVTAAVGACLAGAALALLSAASPWAEALVEPGAPFPSTRQSLTGSDVLPAVPALGLLGLAGVAALLATRRLGRLLVGGVLVLAGAGLAVLAVQYATDPDAPAAAVVRASPGLPPEAVSEAASTAWPWVAVVGGALLVLAGGLALARGLSWAAMSGRYDAPGGRGQRAARPKDPDAAAWDALDRGEDPTA